MRMHYLVNALSDLRLWLSRSINIFPTNSYDAMKSRQYKNLNSPHALLHPLNPSPLPQCQHRSLTLFGTFVHV